jgi:hypothetical protein
MPVPSFDLHPFAEALYRECANAYPRILRDLRDERIYSLALYNSGDSWEYVFPTVSTHAGLDRAAQSYKALPLYSRFSVEELQCLLKWNPCDSPHHEAYIDCMPDTDVQLGPIAERLQSLETDEATALHERLVGICLDVLKRLDLAGSFGEGVARSEIIVNLLNGDQSDEERLERATALNSVMACETLSADFEAAAGACQL